MSPTLYSIFNDKFGGLIFQSNIPETIRTQCLPGFACSRELICKSRTPYHNWPRPSKQNTAASAGRKVPPLVWFYPNFGKNKI